MALSIVAIFAQIELSYQTPTLYVHVTVSLCTQVDDVFRLTTFSVQLLVYLVEFVLSFFPEPKPRRRLYQLGLDDEVGTTV